MADLFGRYRLAIIQEATTLVRVQIKIILVLECIIHDTGTHKHDTCPSHHNMALHSQNLADGYSTNSLFSRDKGSYKELMRGKSPLADNLQINISILKLSVTHICTLMSEKHLKPNTLLSEVQISTYTHTHTDLDHLSSFSSHVMITPPFHLFRVNTLMLFLSPLLLPQPHSNHKQVSRASTQKATYSE